MLRRVQATRYVVPLREGGSLPGIVEGDDLGTYVAKFRGAGQGVRVLVAEVIVGEIARRLDIATPELVALDIRPAIARYEADEEVQDLLNNSLGLNLGIDYLPGSFGFDSAYEVDPELAARIVWLDAFVANVDRSWRNPNLLVWNGVLYAIDHGAALYFHHSWPAGMTDPGRFASQPWNAADHALLAYQRLDPALFEAANTASRRLLGREVFEAIVALVPAEWFDGEGDHASAHDENFVRGAYTEFLTARLGAHHMWLPGGTP